MYGTTLRFEAIEPWCSVSNFLVKKIQNIRYPGSKSYLEANTLKKIL